MINSTRYKKLTGITVVRFEKLSLKILAPLRTTASVLS